MRLSNFGFVCIFWLSAAGADQVTSIDAQELVRQVKLDGDMPSTYIASEGSFTLTSDVRDDPQVECRWATARMSDGRAAPRAQDLVLYFHQPGNLEFQRDPLFRALVERCGFTVCGVRFPASSEPSLFPDRDRFYAFSRSGSFATIRRALAILRDGLSLPEAPFFLFGYSAGGIGVQRFAEEYPELCGGVASYCGHSFVQKNKARCPFLIIHNFGDNAENGLSLETYYRNLGAPVIRLTLPPVWELVKLHGEDACHHQNSPCIGRLVPAYFMALADRRREGAARPWPLTVLAADHHVVVNDVGGTPPDKPTTQMPSIAFHDEVLRIPPEPTIMDLPDGRSMTVAFPVRSRQSRGLLAIIDSTPPVEAASFLAATPRNFALRYGAALGFVTVMSPKEGVSEADLLRVAELAHAQIPLRRAAIIQAECLDKANLADAAGVSAFLTSIDAAIGSSADSAKPQ